MTVRDEQTVPPRAVGTPAPRRFDRAALLSAGGILAALGAASCCVVPFTLFLAGISGVWIGNLTALEPYQPVFAAVSVGFIGCGAWRVYRKPKVACADGYCATPGSHRIAKIGLWAAALLVILAVGFPYAIRYVLVS
ncbi:mercuric transporter MerT family protein [Mesorhizobium sp. B4-1-1]|uniref:mercuric transporter MerT family protein n=1 Tax=Mesorhizobium sp. B4-1-1 TaxID=2589890 RepID=UPI0011288EB0|nr:mercuric transporter MerT family protein [Mesorhizobium sp. B4-1-1]TPI19361.1 mercury transporter MerT [Mesorhizobium sp. B4-1-1]